MIDLVALVDRFPFVPIVAVFVFVIYWVVAFFIIYHLVRFGIGPRPKASAMIFFFGSAVLFMIAFVAYINVDLTRTGSYWSDSFNLIQGLPTPHY